MLKISVTFDLRGTVTRGICKLCLREKDLCKSHFLPAAVYDLLRTRDKEPVVLVDGLAMHSSRQAQDYLLCLECEDILSSGGETWFVPLLADVAGRFPLYDILSKVPADVDEPDLKAYAGVKNPDLEVDKR